MSEVLPGDSGALRTTPLHGLHVELGARMVPFAGYDMPVQYPSGILAEHTHTRTAAGLFDVSHMGQARLTGADPARALETVVPGNITGLAKGRVRYTMFTNDAGGILDDLTVAAGDDHVAIVVNAACKDADYAHMRAALGDTATLHVEESRALLALQGPQAAAVLARHAPGSADLQFLQFAAMAVGGIPCSVARSGYTGEDGFEISVADEDAEALARLLLAEPEVAPIGLGARDSLRLEAGLCLYGHDLDTTTTPVEARLLWTIPKARREAGGYPGADVIRRQIAEGVTRTRVGIRPSGRAPAREGADVVDPSGRKIGILTSGGYGPTVGGPVAMGYVEPAFAEAGSELGVVVRGATHAAQVAALPFAPHRYQRG
ncbi:MAG: glycine cleavage system aminomethyltransferase GcvT [Proteobacteria bacterium]|nr:glycine cleavage system aminomethyltransferase GcvT [Pseudomonadota bacterium]MDA1132847.1 glycine cleavage system aminomethyltransferase GcvT [Pseudomonadota bacterium]